MEIINRKSYRYLFVLLLLLFIIHTLNFSAQGSEQWWNDQWSYRQEILLPEQINHSYISSQPIDIRIDFEKPCWSINETFTSIRIIRQNNGIFQELESQIYDIYYLDETTAESCNIVFLLPTDTTKTDTFYLYYDDSKTPQMSYPDHVSIKDSSYYYEPISGYPLSSKFYHILQDGHSIYAISQEGRFMDYYTAQSVTKLTENQTTVSPNSGQVAASFDYSFFYGDALDESYTTSRKLVSKQINIDGNLKVSCTINSTSSTNDMFSTVTYTYYYCPTAEKRIFSHVTHQIQDAYTVSDNVLTDGIYTTLFVSSVRSTAIQQLNFGRIPEYIHFINEDDEFKEYVLDPNPTYISNGECIPVIPKEYDQDLSSIPWICFDDGKTGMAHAVFFNTTQVVQSGENERNGVQIKAYELDSPHLPGFENNMAVILLGRNSYEPSEKIDTKTPKNFTVSFYAEFYTTPTGGYPQVITEASTFQKLLPFRHRTKTNQQEIFEREQTYDLTVYTHNLLTIPQSQAFNLLAGLNLSFIQVELYQNETLICSGSPSRIHIQSSTDTSALPILNTLKRWDWRNTTIYKSITFKDLPKGDYVIKVIQCHPPFQKPHQFIGVKTIHLDKTIRTHVSCTKQKIVTVTATDQHDQPLRNAQVQVRLNEIIISTNITDETGKTKVALPTSSSSIYQFSIYYKGFLVSEQTMHISKLTPERTLNISTQVEQYNLILQFKDTWGLPPSITIYPTLQSCEQHLAARLQPFRTSQGIYEYTSLPRATYLVKYTSSSKGEPIDLNADTTLTLQIPDVYHIAYSLFNKRGLPINFLSATILRQNTSKSIELKTNTGILSLPPGTYRILMQKNDKLIGSRYINVFSDRSVDILTTVDPLDTNIIFFIIIILLLTFFFLFIRYKTYSFTLLGLLLVLIFLSVSLPWWSIEGDTDTVHATTSFNSLPPNLITIYTNQTIQTGELSSLPPVLYNTFIGFLILIFIGSTGQILFITNIETRIKSYSKNIIYTSIMAIIVSTGFVGNTIVLMFLSDVTTGSFFGSGPIEMAIPGEATNQLLESTWAPTIVWYSTLFLSILLWTILFHQIWKRKNNGH